MVCLRYSLNLVSTIFSTNLLFYGIPIWNGSYPSMSPTQTHLETTQSVNPNHRIIFKLTTCANNTEEIIKLDEEVIQNLRDWVSNPYRNLKKRTRIIEN